MPITSVVLARIRILRRGGDELYRRADAGTAVGRIEITDPQLDALAELEFASRRATRDRDRQQTAGIHDETDAARRDLVVGVDPNTDTLIGRCRAAPIVTITSPRASR